MNRRKSFGKVMQLHFFELLVCQATSNRMSLMTSVAARNSEQVRNLQPGLPKQNDCRPCLQPGCQPKAEFSIERFCQAHGNLDP